MMGAFDKWHDRAEIISDEVETKPNVGEWMGETNGND